MSFNMWKGRNNAFLMFGKRVLMSVCVRTLVSLSFTIPSYMTKTISVNFSYIVTEAAMFRCL